MNEIQVVPSDPLFPDLARALDPEKMMNVLHNELSHCRGFAGTRLNECVPVYVRYKPGVSCIIGYHLHVLLNGGESLKQRLYGRFISPEDAEEMCQKSSKTHTAAPPFGPPFMAIERPSMLISFYPNDRRLRGLRFILDPDKLKRVAQRSLQGRVDPPWWIRARRTKIDVLSYKPERHCVVRCNLYLRNVEMQKKKRLVVIGKLLPREEGMRIFDINTQIWNAGERDGSSRIIPEPLAFDSSTAMFFQEELEGDHPTPDRITDHRSWLDALGKAAESLRRLHGLELERLQPSPTYRELEGLKNAIRETADVLPDMREDLISHLFLLEEKFPLLEEKPLRPVHGDFHGKQILISGEKSVILDLDQVKASDPLLDVGNFTAHLAKYECLGICSRLQAEEAERVFLENYFMKEPKAYVSLEYRWFKKLALVKLALSCVKYLLPGWKEDMIFFLQKAESIPLELQRKGNEHT